MKTYSNKSNARRAAKAAGLDVEAITFVQNAEGWYWEAAEVPAVDQAVAEAIAEVDTSAEDAALAALAPVKEKLKTFKEEFGDDLCPVCNIGLVRNHEKCVCQYCKSEVFGGTAVEEQAEEPIVVNGHLEDEVELNLVVAQIAEGIKVKKEKEYKKEVAKMATKGLKIERNRDEQNGVKRPSVGSTCRQLWDMFDTMYAEKGIVPTPAPAKAKSAEQGMSPVTTTVQLYQWRAFMGFKGR